MNCVLDNLQIDYKYGLSHVATDLKSVQVFKMRLVAPMPEQTHVNIFEKF